MAGEPQRVCLELGEETKAQHIRLLDVFMIGPLMIWGGYALQREGRRVAGPVLALTGVATIYYNGRNYVRVRRRLREQQQPVGWLG